MSETFDKVYSDKWIKVTWTSLHTYRSVHTNKRQCKHTSPNTNRCRNKHKKPPFSSSVSVCDWLVLVSCPAIGSMTSKLLLPISLTAFCPVLSGSHVGQRRHLKTSPLYSCLSHLPFVFPSSWTASAWRMNRRSDFLFFPCPSFPSHHPSPKQTTGVLALLQI